jgi:uncharacterized membrane protein (UPF0136 family)
MGILLAFAPFIAFALLDRLVGATPGLIAATLVSAGLLVRDAISPNRSAKVLEIGTFVVFGVLTAYTLIASAAWSVFGVRLYVDAGLLLVVLISMAIRRPFTLQYARETSPAEIWTTPEFIRVNYIITAVWALAFVVMVAADVIEVTMPNLPQRIGIWATILALVGAIRFTSWYPERQQKP